jgi:hypothetical protein
MDERDEQSSKHPLGRCLINLGIIIDWRFKHPWKQYSPIDSLWTWNIIDERDEHP